VDNVMMDIETLDTGPRAAVISVGLAWFDAYKVGHSRSMKVPLEPQLKMGRTVSADTLRWWMRQSDAARAEFEMSGDLDDEASLVTTMKALRHWISDSKVWGCGSDFDNVIISSLMEDVGVDPWPFWKNRCYRTLKSIHADVLEPTREGTHHTAEDDAKHQATYAQKIVAAKGIIL